MKPQSKETYIGIDINNSFIQISYYQTDMKEPETISVIAGEEKYLIPTALCQKKSSGAWHYGEEAKRIHSNNEGTYIDNLLEKAIAKEEILLDELYYAQDLFFILLRKILKLITKTIEQGEIAKLTFTVEEVTLPLVSLLERAAEILGIKREALAVQDYKESFYYYALCQPKEMWQNDIALFEYRKNYIVCLILHKDMRQNPIHAAVEELYLGTLPENPREKDALFETMVKNAFEKRIFSAVYLIGDGFEGDWMKSSLNLLCRGRRVFQGKNLYTKGACYSGFYANHDEEWNFSYFCSYKTTENISLQVHAKEKIKFYPLVKACSNHHEINTSCEVLIDGEPAIELWIQKPGSQEATIKILELPGLPIRPARTTRLKIEVLATKEGDILVKVTDLGLGELFPASGKTWEFEI